ncbi:hypothetical protein GCM10009788_43750 [Nocardioides humi]|uniref:Uncharacterized protein n=1 Tax=Nocardioides humi TaxID=449461 RepID=A0ABN2B8W9_9ACTN
MRLAVPREHRPVAVDQLGGDVDPLAVPLGPAPRDREAVAPRDAGHGPRHRAAGRLGEGGRLRRDVVAGEGELGAHEEPGSAPGGLGRHGVEGAEGGGHVEQGAVRLPDGDHELGRAAGDRGVGHASTVGPRPRTIDASGLQVGDDPLRQTVRMRRFLAPPGGAAVT